MDCIYLKQTTLTDEQKQLIVAYIDKHFSMSGDSVIAFGKEVHRTHLFTISTGVYFNTNVSLIKYIKEHGSFPPRNATTAKKQPLPRNIFQHVCGKYFVRKTVKHVRYSSSLFDTPLEAEQWLAQQNFSK